MTATWSTPSDFAVAHVVTAAEYNTVNGASGDVMYLYNLVSSTSVTVNYYNSTTRQLNGTVYQNTTGKKIEIATGVQLQAVAGDSAVCAFKCDSTSSPSTTVAYPAILASTAQATFTFPVSFIVPPNYYYSAVFNSTAATASLSYNWRETIF